MEWPPYADRLGPKFDDFGHEWHARKPRQAAQSLTSGNMDALADGVTALMLAKNQMAAMTAVARVDAQVGQSTIDMLV